MRIGCCDLWFISLIYEPEKVIPLCLMESIGQNKRVVVTILIINATMQHIDPHYGGLLGWFCMMGHEQCTVVVCGGNGGVWWQWWRY